LVAIASVDMEQQARIQANSPRRHPEGYLVIEDTSTAIVPRKRDCRADETEYK
jgi:hypothetical protein